jgi:hypothetical protein
VQRHGLIDYRNHYDAIGACAIPAGLLLAGDRVAIHYDPAHSGTASGFTFEVDWAATPILNRTSATSDALVSGRADAAVLAMGMATQIAILGHRATFSASVAPSTDALIIRASPNPREIL